MIKINIEEGDILVCHQWGKVYLFVPTTILTEKYKLQYVNDIGEVLHTHYNECEIEILRGNTYKYSYFPVKK